MGRSADWEDRFWDKVDVRGPDECWEWTASTSGGDYCYGQLRVNGRLPKAHRLAWEIEYGPIPDGLYVLHKCDNPPCCNPAHLFLGTHADNMRDRNEKGRTARGIQNPTGKLTRDSVRQVRTLYATGKFSQMQLGKRFGVSFQTIGSIVRREKWAWLD